MLTLYQYQYGNWSVFIITSKLTCYIYFYKSILSKRDTVFSKGNTIYFFKWVWSCTVYNGRANLFKIIELQWINALNNLFVIWSLFLRRGKKRLNVNRFRCEQIGEFIFGPYRPALIVTMLSYIPQYSPDCKNTNRPDEETHRAVPVQTDQSEQTALFVKALTRQAQYRTITLSLQEWGDVKEVKTKSKLIIPYTHFEYFTFKFFL